MNQDGFNMGQRLRKETLERMRTAKILTSLRIRTGWSGSLLFAYTIKGNSRRYRTNSEDLDPTCGCANWSRASPFVYTRKAFLSACGQYIESYAYSSVSRVERWFVCCWSLFMCWWFNLWHLFCHCLFLISPCFGHPGRAWFVIVAFLYLYF